MARMSARERKLAETLASPGLWGQGYLRNRDGSPRVYWPHQVEDLLCREKNIIHLDGREMKKRTKELMTSLINSALHRRQIVFPIDDLEIEDQFMTHTYTLRDGRVVYSKGHDLIIGAESDTLLPLTDKWRRFVWSQE